MDKKFTQSIWHKYIAFIWLAVVGMISVHAAAIAPTVEAPLRRVLVDHQQPEQLAIELTGEGFDVMEGSQTGSSLEVIVTEEELLLLWEKGLQVIEIELGRPLRELLPVQDGSDAVPTGYFDLNGINARMVAIAESFPEIAQVVDLTDTYNVPPTAEGRHIFVLKISDNVASEEDEPATMFVSNHHAREIVTPVIALNAMEKLTQGYGTDARITDVVDNNEIWIAPTWNPDGYNQVIVGDNLWRKNRKRNASGSIGVDLNRNYPQGWRSSCSGSTSASSNTYKGTSAASESETQTMMAWSQDQKFAKVIDYHSRGREALYTYNCSQHPFTSWFRNQAVTLSRASGYNGQVRPPSAEGEHYQWQLGQLGAWAFLIETEAEFQPPFSNAQREANRVWPGVLHALERSITLSGHITDVETGAPLNASIELLNVNFRNGERNADSSSFGRYHLFAAPGTYNVQFAAEGYETKVQSVSVASNTSSAVLDIQLQADGATGELPVVSVIASDAAASEAGLDTGTLTFSRTGDTTSALTLNYTLSGSATNGTDYDSKSGIVTIRTGQSSRIITIKPKDDRTEEGDENVIVTLSANTAYEIGTSNHATVTISDNDAATALPVITVVASDALAAEAGRNPGALTFSRSGDTASTLMLRYTLSGSATNGTDYDKKSGTVRIRAGQSSRTISIKPKDDTAVEDDENVIVTLSANAAYEIGAAGEASVTISDNDTGGGNQPVVTVVASDALASEAGRDPGTLTFSRTGATRSNLALRYTLSGSATNGTDYDKKSGIVRIRAGQSGRSITIKPKDDTSVEGNENVIVTLSVNTAYEVGAAGEATVIISDNDTGGGGGSNLPEVSISFVQDAREAGVKHGRVRLERTGRINRALTVRYSDSGSAQSGTDYKVLTGSKVIKANKRSVTFDIVPINDSQSEDTETVVLTLESDAAYRVSNKDSATVNVIDND